MNRLNLIRIILIFSLILSIIFFLLGEFSRSSFGGCYIEQEIQNISNPENVQVEFLTGKTCFQSFNIINYEENLSLYSIKGEIITFDKEVGIIENVSICLRDIDNENWSSELIKQTENPNSCSPINLTKGEDYEILRVQNSWELVTDKGIITGKTEYTDLSSRVSPNKMFFIISGITFLIFIISLILTLIFNKKK